MRTPPAFQRIRDQFKEQRNVIESDFTHGCMAFAGSIAIIALVLLAIGTMLGMVKPVDALKHVVAATGILIAVVILATLVVHTWATLTIWQRLGIAAIGAAIWHWRRPRLQSRRRRKERVD